MYRHRADTELVHSVRTAWFTSRKEITLRHLLQGILFVLPVGRGHVTFYFVQVPHHIIKLLALVVEHFGGVLESLLASIGKVYESLSFRGLGLLLLSSPRGQQLLPPEMLQDGEDGTSVGLEGAEPMFGVVLLQDCDGAKDITGRLFLDLADAGQVEVHGESVCVIFPEAQVGRSQREAPGKPLPLAV